MTMKEETMKLMRIAALLGACALILSACTTEKRSQPPSLRMRLPLLYPTMNRKTRR